MKHFNYIFLIFVYISSSLVHLAGQGEVTLFSSYSISTKKAASKQLSYSVLKLPRHLVPSFVFDSDNHTAEFSQNTECYFTPLEVLRINENNIYQNPTLIRFPNKAPPLA